ASAAAGTSGTAPAATAAAETPPANDYVQIQQRNAARQKQILQIKERYSQLFLDKKRARSDKAADDAAFRSAKIKKSKTEVDSTMKLHNQKIEAIEAEEAKLRAEMARIQSEFE